MCLTGISSAVQFGFKPRQPAGDESMDSFLEQFIVEDPVGWGHIEIDVSWCIS